MRKSKPIFKSKNEKRKGFKRLPSLARRNHHGDILPIIVPLFEHEEDIALIPLTLGEINEIHTESILGIDMNFEKCIVDRCLVKPDVSYKEFKKFKLSYRNDIVKTLLFESGFDIEQLEKGEKKEYTKKSKKRLLYESFKRDIDETRRAVYAHKNSYTFFEYYKLTLREIDILSQTEKRMENEAKNGAKVNG